MKLPNITKGEWHVACNSVWAGRDGLSVIFDADSIMHSEASDADLYMCAAAPDMFHALNCILSELRGRRIELDNTTLAIASMVKAGGRFNADGST